MKAQKLAPLPRAARTAKHLNSVPRRALSAPGLRLVENLAAEPAGVEIGAEARYLLAVGFEDAHAVVLDGRAVGRRPHGRPFQRRALVCGKDVSEGRPHLAEGVAVFRPPEVARALAAVELLG